METISLICETLPMRDFANFGHLDRCAISLGRKRNHWRETISLICETWSVRDFANFGNRGRFAISLGRKRGHWAVKISLIRKTWQLRDFANFEIVTDARFRMAGKRNPWKGNDFTYSETRSVRDCANFGNRDRIAISLGRETEPLGGGRFRLCRKRCRCAIARISDIVADARFHLAGKRNHWHREISLIWKTMSMRDFANFGHRGRCAISVGRKTEPMIGKRFRLFGKHGRCAISLISDIVVDARFRLSGKRGHLPGRFR